MEEVFAQARNAESEAEELLVDDGWKVVEVEPETIAVNGNGNGHHDLFGPTVELVPVNWNGEQRPPRRDPGAAADAVLLGGVHGRGAGEAEGPGPQASARSHVPVRVGAGNGAGKRGGAGRRGGARPQHTGGGRRYVSDDLPLRNHVCGLFCVSARSVHVCGPFLLPHFPVEH